MDAARTPEEVSRVLHDSECDPKDWEAAMWDDPNEHAAHLAEWRRRGAILHARLSGLSEPEDDLPDDVYRRVGTMASREVAGWPQWRQHPTRVARSERWAGSNEK